MFYYCKFSESMADIIGKSRFLSQQKPKRCPYYGICEDEICKKSGCICFRTKGEKRVEVRVP